MPSICLPRLRLLFGHLLSCEALTNSPGLHLEPNLLSRPDKPHMESHCCGLRVSHQGDCAECVLLAAGVPRSHYPPLIRAASHPDIRLLHTLLINLVPERPYPVGVANPLNEISNGDYGPWKSSLTEAILAEQFENAALLLEYHADPNGFPIDLLSSFSSCFVRHRPMHLCANTLGSLPPREKILVNIESPQTEPLTDFETEARRSSRCRFWAEPDFPSLESAFKAPFTALEAAAKVNNKETFACLVEAGADTTAWTTGRKCEVPDPASPSFLALSTPLHRAIKAEHPPMVAYLLSSHHSPDYFPLSTITRSLNATMYALTLPALSRIVLDLLLPATDLSARTPIYDCHILHIAAATLDLDLFRHISEAVGPVAQDLSSLLPTAIGHTVLHIACLPRDDSCINLHSQKIYESIHDVRTLGDTWQPLNSQPHAPPQSLTPAGAQTAKDNSPREALHSAISAGAATEPPQPPPTTDNTPTTTNPNPEHAAQSALIRHLLKSHHPSPLAALAAQDIHGNTPLHYLASARDFNHLLWTWICGMIKRWRKAEARPPPPPPPLSNAAASGYDPLIGIRNRWGYSPADFYVDGMEARKEWGRGWMPFWLLTALR